MTQAKVAAVSTGHIVSRQIRLTKQTTHSQSFTIFTPPGICMNAAKYPIMHAGVLGTTQPSEHLSIFDHPDTWEGIGRDAILSMRRSLYQFQLPVDARSRTPKDVVETLQKIALSVSPVAIGVEGPTLPPRHLTTLGGQLPAGPLVPVREITLLTEPEISLVAQRITEKDVHAAEAIWQLIGYDYSLEQTARLICVGLLGKHKNRRMVPMRSSLKIAIDTYIDMALMELSEKSTVDSISFQTANVLGDTFVVISKPGESRVDYVNVTKDDNGYRKGYSFESLSKMTSDARTAMYAAHSRFSAYRSMIESNSSSHKVILHFSPSNKNNILGPWVARSGVSKALSQEKMELDTMTNLSVIMENILQPPLAFWSEGIPLLERIGFEESPITGRIK